MKCPKCGKEIANDSNFCEFCGERITNPIVRRFRLQAWIVGLCTLLIAVSIGYYILNLPSNGSLAETPQLTHVDDFTWDSPIGKAIYSGYVIKKGKVPHTNGIAQIIQGKYAGCVYEGEFNMGKMDGRAKYTRNNGDVFIGVFKDGQYDRGKYVIASSGKYFEGTFKNGQPDKGHWYDKNGNKK